MITKSKVVLFFVTCSLLLATSPVLAASPTATPKPTKTISSTPTPSGVRDDVKERVQERIEEVKQKAFQRAFWGTLKQRMDTTLIINSSDGEKRIKTNKETVFVGIGKKEIKISDIEIDNFLIALGYWQDNGSLDAKRVLVLSAPPKPTAKRYTLHGLITKIDKTKKIIEITGIKNKNIAEVQFSSSTFLTKKTDGKIQPTTFDKLQIGDRIIVISTKKINDSLLVAKIIHIIPSANPPQSPTPTPKPTKTPKLSPTPTPIE